ncbi:amino acid adenylation domain-containing protein [Paenibacillus sp. SN-8-1]|uniref:amino acid adenylation domain-containing protein n=1 Tax=Paenibacillus sp. SN-8-1 TaxID=3435409 RepID=UPI003D9A9741
MKILAAYPMTELQRGIAYECELHAGEDVYASQAIIHLNYDDLACYKKAWEQIINQYEIFKTKFIFGDLKEDVQVVLSEGRLDWRNTTCAEQDLEELAQKEKGRLTKVSDFPLMCFVQVSTENGVYLIWTFHHILLDGWSMSLTLQAVDQAYDSLQKGEDASSIVNTAYSEYISWKLTNTNTKSESFWTQYLSNCKGFEFPRMSRYSVSSTFDEVKVEVSAAKKLLLDYCKKHQISPAIFYQTLWASILSIYTGKQEIIFEVIDSGRSKKSDVDLEKIIGLLIEKHPKRVSISPTQRFVDLLNSIKMDDLSIKEHDFLSNTQAKTIMGLTTADNYSNTTFVFENYPSTQGESRFDIVKGSETSTSDLTFSAGIMGDSVVMKVMFATDVMDRDQVSILLQSMNRWIEFLLHSDETLTVGALFDQIPTSRVNSAIQPYPKEATFFELISKVSEDFPEKIAIYDQKRAVSYQELVEEAVSLINSLYSIHIDEGKSVALHLPRSANSIALMIALQYLGIPYTYLDEKNNQERLEYILQDANVGLILKSEDSSSLNISLSVNCVSISVPELVDQPKTETSLPTRKNNKPGFCQLIYTSGSTGQPKGIEMTSENIISFAINNGFYSVKPDDNFAQAASIAFDASIFEIWLPLLNGAAVTIIPDPVFDIFNWSRNIDEYQITTAWLTSGLFNTFVDLDFSKINSLKKIYVGGEVVSPSHIKRAMSVTKETRFYNGYGPTENTTFTTTFEIPRDFDSSKPIAIGKLLANSKAMVLNEVNQPVPIGVPGELVVSGSGLTNGYRNKNELTQRAFVEMNFEKESCLAYRTGDIVYFDGEHFYYVGRKDKQIKLRGFRIELGEIEYALNQLTGVKQSVAVLEDNNQVKEIEAFYVGDLDEMEVSRALSQRLPSYMLPKRYHRVQNIPLTLNGKIDRNKLLIENQRADYPLKQDQLTPSLLQESTDIFRKYAAFEELDIEQDLFEFGIDSLTAVRINHEMNKVFGTNVSLKQFIESKRIKELITLFDTPEETKESVHLDQPQFEHLAFATELQKSMYYFQLENPQLNMYNIPFVRELGQLPQGGALVKERYFDILKKNPIFQAHLKEDDTGNLAWFKSNVMDPAFYEHFADTHEEKESIIKQELNYSFDLKNPKESLIRMSLIHCHHSIWLVTVTHHLIFDGSSMEILLNELLSTTEISDSKSNYFDYLNHYSSLDHHKNLEYWNEKLKDIQPNINFAKPTDFVFDHKGAMVNISLSKSFIQKINDVAKKEKVSKYMVTLSFYTQFLMSYFNQKSVIVGTPVSTRPNEYHDVYGMFLSFLPLVNKKSPDKTFKDILNENRYLLFEIMDYATIDYHTLEKACGMANSHDGLSFIQTVLNYQELSNTDAVISEDAQIIAKDRQFAQFPLTLTVYETLEESFIQVEYGTSLFTEEQIVHFMDHFINWFDSAMNSIESLVIDTPLYSQQESKKLVRQLNPTFEIRHQSLIEYLQAISPDNHQLAIVDGEKRISYAELNEHIIVLAEKLIQAGMKKGDKIVYFGHRCWQQVLLFYTCLVHEFVYIPIDSKHSQSRLEEVIKEVEPNFIIYSSSLDAIALRNSCHVDRMLEDEFYISDVRGSDNKLNLAYILFTSGTTGKPKGVQISRENLANLAASIKSDYPIEQNWKTVNLSSISFDANIMDIMTTIVPGNTLYIFNEEHQFLPDFIKQNDINFMIITPTLFNVLDFTHCHSLKLILSGGEKFRKNETLPSHVQILNGYGPTEATICIAFTDKNHEQTVGKPVSNSCVVVMDEGMNVLPHGVRGEICVVGPSVMKSYLTEADNVNRLYNAPDYLREYGEVLYRTGDLGSFDEEGNIYYYGRNDNQVKVRGHRIELSEITERLLQHPIVSEAYTKLIVDPDKAQEKIVSYIVPNNVETCSTDDLKGFLYETLPTYMIPDIITPIENFNVTVNGKIDPSLLPIPSFRRVSQKESFAETELEIALLEIWRQVFQTEEISVRDSYFDIGGDSIKSIRIVSKLRDQGIQLSSKDILKYQTIRSVAKHISENESDHKAYHTGENVTSFFITPIQEWFYQLGLKNENYWNQSTVFTMKAPAKEEELLTAYRLMYDLHPMLRAQIKKDKKGNQVVVMATELLDFEGIIQKFESKEELHRNQEQLQQSINLYEGPTSRIAYCIENNVVTTYWIAHHLFIDAYSWEILQSELVSTLEDKSASVEILDQMTNEELINQQRRNAASFEVVRNERNKLYQKVTNDVFFKIRKSDLHNVDNINLPLVFSSIFFGNVLRKSKGDLYIYQEKNSRFTNSYKMFNLNHSVGWLTEFSQRVVHANSQHEKIYGLLFNERNQLVETNEDQDVQAMFLNIVNVNDSVTDEQHVSDIAAENMEYMPPMLNILNGENFLTVTLINVCGAAELYQETLANLKEIIQNEYFTEYLRYVETMGEAFINFSEFVEIKNNEHADLIFPLFPLQEEILYSSAGTSESYMNEFSWTTTVSIEEMIARFNTVVQKYEALRTTIYRTKEQNFVQIIHGAREAFPYHVYDLREQSTSEQKQTIATLIDNESRNYRKMSSNYLHGVYFLRLSNNKTRVIWLFNHLILDGWSVGIVLNELWNEHSHENIDSSNLDYVRWLQEENNQANTAVLDDGNEHIDKIGKLFPENTKIYTTNEINIEERFSLSDELSKEINTYVRKNNLTLAGLLNFVWGYILCELTETRSVVIGIVDSGRDCPVDRIESKVGLFIRTIASIFTIDEDKKIQTILQENNQKMTSDLYQGRQDTRKLRQKLNLKPAEELYETILVVENYPEAELVSEEITDVEAKEQSNYPLSLSIGMSEKLIFKITYNESLVLDSAVKKMGLWMEELLRTIVENDQLKVRELPHRVIKLLNTAGKQYEETVLEPSKEVVGDSLNCSFEQMKEIWANVLGHNDFVETDDFFEIGGDSLKLSKMIFILKEDFNYELEVLKFFENPTLQNLKNSDLLNIKELDEEHSEDHTISQVHLGSFVENNKVLVTGATGLLGSEIVYQCLAQGKEVYCLTRGRNPEEITQRVLDKLAEIVPNNKILNLENLNVLQGDLSEDYFGLDLAEYQKISMEISTIYHCAGNVNFMASMKEAREVNVQGLKRIMHFAQNGRMKKLNHVSTLSVVGHDHYLIDDIDLAPISYVKSKILAEQYLRNYRPHRNGIQISRIGRIAGNSRTFSVPRQDLFWRLIVSIAQLGCCPDEFLPFETDLTPVDIIARELIRKTEATDDNQVINYFTNCMISFGRCVELMEEVLGRKIDVVPYEEWLSRAEHDSEENQIKVLIPLFRENVFYEPEENSITTENSPDKSIQFEELIEENISDEVVVCYLKNVLKEVLEEQQLLFNGSRSPMPQVH